MIVPKCLGCSPKVRKIIDSTLVRSGHDAESEVDASTELGQNQNHSEMDEDRSSRRWFTEGSIAQAAAPAGPTAPAPSYDGTAEEHARRIIEVMVANNPIGRRAS
nr:hypothetical protein [Adlercreutzia caecimuris]